MDNPLNQNAALLPIIEKAAADVANNVITERLSQAQFDVSKIQDHHHNGVDSIQIDFPDLNSASSYRAIATKTLTSTQIKALNTKPITLVPGFGSRTITIVEGIEAYLNYNGTAYTGANNLEFRYTGAAGAKVTADISTTLLNSGATAYSHVAGVVTELVPVANAVIVVRVPTANPATGNSPITLNVLYRIVSFA